MNLSERINEVRGNVCNGCGELIVGNYDALRQHRVYACNRSQAPRKARWLRNEELKGKVIA